MRIAQPIDFGAFRGYIEPLFCRILMFYFKNDGL